MEIKEILDFEDTKTAFASLSDTNLKRAAFLFKVMSNPMLVKAGTKLTLLSLKLNLPLESVLKNTIYDHFCGGSSFQQVNNVVDKYAKYGISTILNYGIEGKHNEEEFNKTAELLNKTLEFAIKNKNIKTIACKPSGLISHDVLEKITAKQELNTEERNYYNRGLIRISNLIEKAYKNKISVHLDAEETWIQGAIDEIALKLSAEFNKDFPTVINGIQLYVKDKLEFLKYSLDHAIKNNYIAAVKLVRGAYMEKERQRAEDLGYPSPICQNKTETDENYNAGLKFCIENINVFHLSNATHNEESCKYLANLMSQNGLAHNHERILTSQLKGMSDNITFAMAASGYNVQKYLPYGPVMQVVPYLIRRAQENTSVKGQTNRELELINKEIKRRGL